MNESSSVKEVKFLSLNVAFQQYSKDQESEIWNAVSLKCPRAEISQFEVLGNSFLEKKGTVLKIVMKYTLLELSKK